MNPSELLAAMSQRLWALAEAAVPQLADPTGLAGLAPDPAAAGTVLDGRLLGPIPAQPAAAGLAGLVRAMLGELTDGEPVRLHGWHREPGALRGLALVAGDGPSRVVLAVTPSPPTLDLVIAGAAPNDEVQFAVSGSSGPWKLDVTAELPSCWDVTVTPAAPPQVRAAPTTGSATVRLERRDIVVGPASGPGLTVEALTATLDAQPAGPPPTLRVDLVEFRTLPVPGALTTLLGSSATDPITVGLLADSVGGLRFNGPSGKTRASLPARLNQPGVTTRDFALSLDIPDTGALHLGTVLSVAAALSGLPMRAQLDDIGIDVPFDLGGGPIGPGAIAPRMPTSIAVELNLPPVSGGGLVNAEGGHFSGLLDLDLATLHVQAVGLLRLPDQDSDLSLLLLISAHFPPPGVQLSFGFALDAVGGLVGINRRANPDALRSLVVEGHADRVLFPDDARGQAGAIIASLDAAFPAAEGRFVIGPMVRITWGGRIVSLSAAVLLELPDPVQLILLGRLLITLPDPAVPLIRLQASVVGRFDPAEPSVELLASLAGSWIVGVPISGEVLLLFRGGRNPTFVLSAGGFHPRYLRPAGVPALRSLAVDLSPGGAWGLRAEAYFAVTSNTVQFGGRVELDATIAGCGVEGWLGLDALFVWDPTFSFAVRVAARVAVRAFGARLASVGLDFTLEGPAPWHAFGTGSVSVLFWDASLDFDITWGDRPALRPVDVDVIAPLREALGRRESWALEQPVAQRTPLKLTPEAKTKLANGELLHPDATLRASQKVLPLSTELTRHNRVPLPAQTWTVSSAQLGENAPVLTGLPAVQEQFLPGQHFALTEEQQLTRGGFEDHPSGVQLAARGAVQSDTPRLVNDQYETQYHPAPEQPRVLLPGGALRWLEPFARLSLPGERALRWAADRPLVAMRATTKTAVQADTMQVMATDVSLFSANADAPTMLAAQLQTSDLNGVQLVEPWEIER